MIVLGFTLPDGTKPTPKFCAMLKKLKEDGALCFDLDLLQREDIDTVANIRALEKCNPNIFWFREPRTTYTLIDKSRFEFRPES